MQFGTSSIWVKSNAVMDIPEFEFTRSPNVTRVRLKSVEVRHRCHWTYAAPPPAIKGVRSWLRREEQVESDKQRATKMHVQAASQFGGPTQAHSFAKREKKKSSNAQRERQNMSCMSLEVFATSKGKFLPNPQSDPIVAVFYCLQDEVTDMEQHPEYPGRPFCYTGILMVKDKALDLRRIGHPNTINVEYFDSELDLINEVVNRVKHWDPDVLAGWEVHASSWGYLVDRAGAEFGFVLSDDLSRVIATQSGPRNDRYSAQHTSSFKVIGRHVFNIWRILRGDLNLLQYSFENVTFQLLHQR
jgi:DNA polymerase zeta